MHLAGHFFRNVPRTVKYLHADQSEYVARRRERESEREKREGGRRGGVVIEQALSQIAALLAPKDERERRFARGWRNPSRG